MLKSILFAVGLAALGANAAPELTNDNFAETIDGKYAFIKFLAPWCGHCKRMKPDWDKLADKYADNKNIVVADVDCTQEKDLCSKYGVKGYPTIKYFTTGTDATGDAYEGGRDYAAMEKFADENLGPSCGPGEHEELCSESQLAILKEAQALSADELTAAVAEKQAEIEGFEEHFKAEVEKLQAQYQELMDTKDKKVADASPSLRLYQAAAAPPADAADAEENKEEL